MLVVAGIVVFIQANNLANEYQHEYYGYCRSLGYDDVKITWERGRIAAPTNFTVECINYIGMERVEAIE